MHKEHHGFLFGLLAALSSTLGALLIKWNAGVPNETMVFARFSVSLLCMLPVLLRGRVQIRARLFGRHLIRGLAGLGSIYCYFYSVEHLPLVNAMTISNTYVLCIPVVVFFWMHVTIPLWRMLGIALGFIGVLLILRPSEGFSEWASVVGLLGGIFSAIALVGVRQLSKTEKTEEILIYYFLVSTVISSVPMVLAWEPIETPFVWVSLGLIGLFSLGFQYCITKSLTHAPATKVSTISYSNVLLSGLLGWWVFGELPTFWLLGGAACIIAGGLISLFSKGESRHWKK